MDRRNWAFAAACCLVAPFLGTPPVLLARNLQTVHEIGRAEAGISSPLQSEAVFYNPAAHADRANYIYSFAQYGFNREGRHALDTYEQIQGGGKGKQVQSSDIMEVLGENQVFSLAAGVTSKATRYLTFGLTTDLNYRAAIAGEILPILDYGASVKLQSFLALAVPVYYSQFAWAVTLKPTYMIEHIVHTDVAEYAEDKHILKAKKRASEGMGTGVDLAASFTQPLGRHKLQSAVVLYNLGALSLSPTSYYNKDNEARPFHEASRLALAASYEYRPPLVGVSKLQAHTAYYQTLVASNQESMYESEVRLGFSAYIGSVCHINLGVYRSYPSYGLGFAAYGMHFAFATYYEVKAPELAAEEDDRRFVAQASLASF